MPCRCLLHPVDEAERKRAWIALPLRVRTAIRRMHRQFGHPSSTVLVQILRAARAPPEYIHACRHVRCDASEDNKPKYQSTKVALPKDNFFGWNLGIDVLDIKDVADEPSLCLNILDLGTTFQQVDCCDRDTVRRPAESAWIALSVCGSVGLVGHKP